MTRPAFALVAVLLAPGAAAAGLTWDGDAPVLVVDADAPRTYRLEGVEGARVRFGEGSPVDVPGKVTLRPGLHPLLVEAPEAGWLLFVPVNASEGGVALPVNAVEPAVAPEPEAGEPPRLEAQTEPAAERASRWIPGPGALPLAAALGVLARLRRSS